MGTAILMYHGIENPANLEEGFRYTVTKSEFIEQLSMISKSSIKVISIKQLLFDYTNNNKRSVIFTFDDGEESVYSMAKPQMDQYGWNGSVYITADWIGKNGYLKPEQIKQLSDNGWSIGSHGLTHKFLRDLSQQDLKHELSESKKIIENIISKEIIELSLPGGRGDERVLTEAYNCGYKILLTSEAGLNNYPVHPGKIKRIAIRRGCSSYIFEKIIKGDPIFYSQEVLKIKGKEMVKKLIGDNRYHFLSQTILEKLKKK